MPKFYQQEEFNVNIEVDEFLDRCNSSEIDEVIDYLIDTGNIDKKCRGVDYEVYNPSESVYQEALDKLNGKWNMLTKEEEELILKIANRF